MRSVEQWKNELSNADATFCSAEQAAAVFILFNLDQTRATEDLANALQGFARLYAPIATFENERANHANL